MLQMYSCCNPQQNLAGHANKDCILWGLLSVLYCIQNYSCQAEAGKSREQALQTPAALPGGRHKTREEKEGMARHGNGLKHRLNCVMKCWGYFS